jgi:glycosyltransferase involved in cell wall biosynthesis
VRICCLNNYPLARMRALAQAHHSPGQHLWGIDALDQHATEVALAPFHEPDERSLLAALSRRSHYRFGQLDQQAYAIGRGPFDAIYSADAVSLRGIAMSKRITGRGARLVSVVHHPVRRTTLYTLALKAHDGLLCLSERLRNETIEQHGLDPDRVHAASWGPDLDFPGYVSTGEHDGVVAAGKSNRDLPILVRALAETGSTGVVYDLGETVADAPAGVRLVRSGGDGTDATSPRQYVYAPVLDRLRAAAVVAIPIADPNRLTGLTELNDALALGKPVVITRSPYTPIDVGEIGCGIVVEPHDGVGWQHALATLAQDDDLRRTMGRRGRLFAERAWSYSRFCSELVGIMVDPDRRPA